ncbi:hypothetical protein [Methylobacter sp. S3L5C]|uniref:hypothetical protein n=1 Tax=Methylobacter sp. S3L5C TaxID=2839024 RepID=UPI001FAC3E03|nr:hypothetical protein [Methylobacter sp. S3L5C]UOA08535.1 hypothetical protein KKZ03_20480 [Methylobacter sp. S3L5C]
MSYGRYKRILLLKRVEVTSARLQKVPNQGVRKVEARLEQRSRIMQERRSAVQRNIKPTVITPLRLKYDGAIACVHGDAMEKN